MPSGGFVLLDTQTTPQLEAEGLARDAIRVVQEARKNAGLDVSDRIVLALNASPEDATALEAHAELIAAETLAVAFAVQPTDDLEAWSMRSRAPAMACSAPGACARCDEGAGDRDDRCDCGRERKGRSMSERKGRMRSTRRC